MADEFKDRRDAALGDRAQALLNDEVLAGIFDNLEAEYIQFWREGTAINDVHGRERLWQAVQIIGKVRSHLSKIAADGRLARVALDRLAQGSIETNR